MKTTKDQVRFWILEVEHWGTYQCVGTSTELTEFKKVKERKIKSRLATKEEIKFKQYWLSLKYLIFTGSPVPSHYGCAHCESTIGIKF